MNVTFCKLHNSIHYYNSIHYIFTADRCNTDKNGCKQTFYQDERQGTANLGQ